MLSGRRAGALSVRAFGSGLLALGALAGAGAALSSSAAGVGDPAARTAGINRPPLGPGVQPGSVPAGQLAAYPDGSVVVPVGQAGRAGAQRLLLAAPNGATRLLAGTGAVGCGGDDQFNATFRSISDVAVAPDGTVVVADVECNVVRRIELDGDVNRIAGTGNAPDAGDPLAPPDGINATAPDLRPRGLSVAGDGTVTFTDQRGNGTSVHRIEGNGSLTSFRAPGGAAVLTPSSAITLAADGRSIIAGGSGLTFIAPNGGKIPLPVRGLRNAVAIERRPNNSILIADAGARRLFVRQANGSSSTLAGNGDTAVYGDAGPSEVVGIGTPAALAGLLSGDVVLHTGTLGRGGIRKVYAPKAIIGAWVTPGGGGSTRPPDPALRRSEVFVPLKGTTRFSQPGESGFRRAQAFKVIRNGARIDTTQGNAVVRTAANGSASQEYYAVVSLGRMQVRQRPGTTETDLTLTDSLQCGRAAATTEKRRRRRARVRGRGRFRSRGRRSNVAARGTEWQLDDTCTASVIRVIEGRVLITDRVRNRNFFARAPRTITIRDR